MESYIQAQGFTIWKKVYKPYEEIDAATTANMVQVEANNKARNYIIQGLGKSDFDRVMHLKSAYHASRARKENIWLVDSGCSHHMSGDKESKLYMPVKELPPLRVRDLFYSSRSDPKKMRELLARAMEATRNSSGVVINTLDALEKPELKRLCQELHIPMVLAPGPLHKLSSKNTRRSSMLDQDCSSSCIEWLDKQPTESVLYVSFGSLASMDAKEFLEVAWGLANSGHPFLWVVREDSVQGFDGGPDFPNGFEAAVHGRGKVIRWAPQLEVLAHPAVGGFWTHNGWNSTLESISEGVPMICRPQFADQMMNTRYVVNTWGVGLELEGELERGKIEEAVRKLMKEKEGEEMRDRAKELKKTVADCLETGGTSQVAIDKLVDYILSM